MAQRNICIDAVLARDSGMPYHIVLETFSINPREFWQQAQRIEDVILEAGGTVQVQLEQIAKYPQRRVQLFQMVPEYLRELYAQVRSNRLPEFPRGTFLHHENTEFLVYHALVQQIPDLNSNDRQTVIAAIYSLPYDLYDYLRTLKLRSALDSHLDESPRKILDIIDKKYMERTGNKSLFDLRSKHHIHEWDHFKLPQNYWRNQRNIDVCVYHVLLENVIKPHNSMRSTKVSPESVVEAFAGIPLTTKYFRFIGLQRVMGNMYIGKTASALDVLRVFDKVYQQKTSNPSLFDSSQSSYIAVGRQNTLSVVHNL